MKEKLARQIVNKRILLLILMLIITAISATTIGKTRINYDLNRYLDDRTMTKQALKVMQEEFGSTEQLRLMFINPDEAMLSNSILQLNDLPEVLLAAYDPETDVRYENGTDYRLVTLTLNDCDTTALVRTLRTMFPDENACLVGGSAAGLLDVQNSVAEEMPMVMVISVLVVLLVLLLTSHAWLEPFVILSVLSLSIVINLGTHFIFPDVSFITFAVSAILQLALSIDYAIMLLHSYNGFCDEGLTPEDAMTRALSTCFMRITSSGLTTIAGLMSLLVMSFTIGFDIGLALSKGILISMLSVFLLMPAITLILRNPLQRTRHRPINLNGQYLAKGIFRARKPIAALLILAVISGFVLQSMNVYTFTESNHGNGENVNKRINAVFGDSSPLVLLVPGGTEDADYETQRTLIENLCAVKLDGEPVLGEISAMVTTGALALEYYTPQEVSKLTGMSILTIRLFFAAHGFGNAVRADHLLTAAESMNVSDESIKNLQKALEQANSAFHGPHYDRMLLELTLPAMDQHLVPVVDQILAEVRGIYGDDFYLTGLPMSTYDIGNAFRGDLLKVNIITFFAILLIVMLSFRSFRLPLLLVFVIEGAIWIGMGLSRVFGQPVFFISYLICVSIQMGATIDYGILLSDQYLSLRRENLSVKNALMLGMKKALPTVMTSGIILITAGYIIGRLCSIFYISDIGLLLSRGTFISVLLILILLPALLTICDRWVMKASQPEK